MSPARLIFCVILTETEQNLFKIYYKNSFAKEEEGTRREASLKAAKRAIEEIDMDLIAKGDEVNGIYRILIKEDRFWRK